MKPAETLLEGAEILARVLGRHGFTFQTGTSGVGSGGAFACGDFVHDDRRLELHFRYSLGLVRYHLGPQSASHEHYMRALGVTANQYPGFSSDPLDGFRHLSHDLSFVTDDFLTGGGDVLRRACVVEAEQQRRAQVAGMAGAVGDLRARQVARESFRKKEFARVVTALETLKFPELLSDAEQKMLNIARERLHRT